MSKSSVAKRVRNIRCLEAAWNVIRANGLRSQSKNTNLEVEQFGRIAGTGLRRIQMQLRNKKFDFPPALGIAIDRGAKKSRRPIVKSPLPSRIVQRAIHDCLLDIKAIKTFVENPNSFGGVRKRDSDARGAVPAAIAEVVKEIGRGARYYIRSDIASFFTKIPKPVVLDIIHKQVKDEESRQLINRAIHIELENMATLRKRGFDALFPIQDIGVAQGNCLSPLLGNILLSEFDERMSDESSRCLRYIDDFIILGANKQAVRKKFREAIQLLAKFNLTAYDPAIDKEKADSGDVLRGLDFLGVSLKNGSIKPSRKSRQRLIRRIENVLNESAIAMSKRNIEPMQSRHTLLHALTTIGGITKGWAEQYSYCNERNIFQTLDREIDKKIGAYIGRYRDIRSSSFDENDKRRLLGVSLLTDTSKAAIEWNVTEPAVEQA